MEYDDKTFFKAQRILNRYKRNKHGGRSVLTPILTPVLAKKLSQKALL